MSLTAGSHLGPYEIIALLGADQMGGVCRAYDVRRPALRAHVMRERFGGDVW
jgi:hypothetical protein